jgi:sugar phosphate isomerase/epimerase
MADKARLSLNQMTTANWSVAEAVEGCVRHGVRSIALWRHKIEEAGLTACVRAVEDAGLHVSSVCRGGMFPAATAEERKKNIEDNFRAADEAAALHADSLVMVVGGCAGVPLEDARQMVADGVAELVPYACKCGVRIGLEPLHPMFAADRSVLVTIDQALELARAYDAREVGVGLMGDGVIDNRKLRGLVEQAGYHGPIEVEIFNRALWDSDPDTVLAQVIERFEQFV